MDGARRLGPGHMRRLASNRFVNCRPLLAGWLLFAITLASVASDKAPAVERRHGRSLRGSVDGLPFLLLRGTHEERGEAHGALAAREIIQSVDGMARLVIQRKANWQQLIDASHRFQIAPRYRQELEAMLRGIRQALPDAADRKVGSLQRELAFDDLRVLQTGDVFELMRCSQFSAWGKLTLDGQVIVGRNFDYPPIFPRETCCVLAIEPAEKDLHPTLDAMWFGIIGAGLATLRDDGLYLAPNSGGRPRRGSEIKQPVPGALFLRSFAESARGDDLAEQFVRAIAGKVVLPLIVHLVPPHASAQGMPPVVIEYTPDSGSFGSRVRRPVAGVPALFLANHFINEEAELQRGRSGTMQTGLTSCAKLDQAIGFAEARKILDDVKQADTYYSAVVWPGKRIMKISIAEPGMPATRGKSVTVRWSDLFSLK